MNHHLVTSLTPDSVLSNLVLLCVCAHACMPARVHPFYPSKDPNKKHMSHISYFSKKKSSRLIGGGCGYFSYIRKTMFLKVLKVRDA